MQKVLGAKVGPSRRFGALRGGLFDCDAAGEVGGVVLSNRRWGVYRFVNGGCVCAGERAALWGYRRTGEAWCGWDVIARHGRRVDAVVAVHFLLHLDSVSRAAQRDGPETQSLTDTICLPEMIFLAFSSSGLSAVTNVS